MKTQTACTVIVLGLLGYVRNGAFADYIVASNITESEMQEGYWINVGLKSPTEGLDNTSAGQAFEPRLAGTLTTIEALVSTSPLPLVDPPPLHVSLYASSGGVPTSLLGTLSFTDANFLSLAYPADFRHTFDFSQFHITLDSSHEYFLAFETPFGYQDSHPNLPAYNVGISQASGNDDHSLSLGHNLEAMRDGLTWVAFLDYKEIGIPSEPFLSPRHSR